MIKLIKEMLKAYVKEYKKMKEWVYNKSKNNTYWFLVVLMALIVYTPTILLFGLAYAAITEAFTNGIKHEE